MGHIHLDSVAESQTSKNQQPSIQTFSTKVNMSAWWIVVLVAALQLANAQDTITTITIRCTGIAQGQPCAVNGNWGAWGAFCACSATCGGGTQSRSRACNNPAPSNGGATCAGSATETAACGTAACPTQAPAPKPCKPEPAPCKTAPAPCQTAPAPCKTAPAPCKTAPTTGCGSSTTTTTSSGCGGTVVKPAPVHGGFSAWGAYGMCSKVC